MVVGNRHVWTHSFVYHHITHMFIRLLINFNWSIDRKRSWALVVVTTDEIEGEEVKKLEGYFDGNLWHIKKMLACEL